MRRASGRAAAVDRTLFSCSCSLLLAERGCVTFHQIAGPGRGRRAAIRRLPPSPPPPPYSSFSPVTTLAAATAVAALVVVAVALVVAALAAAALVVAAGACVGGGRARLPHHPCRLPVPHDCPRFQSASLQPGRMQARRSAPRSSSWLSPTADRPVRAQIAPPLVPTRAPLAALPAAATASTPPSCPRRTSPTCPSSRR